ncbi:MAG: dihydrodipicolinate synthase family protein [Nitratireductor sp.]|nr:dihydrodipicolinate synthase family protein [Nitratireductor sp.]
MPDNIIRGVIAPNLTPFHADLGVDTARYVSHAKHLLGTDAGGGCAGLAPFGTTGEAVSVGMQERMELLDAMVGADIDPARMIVGTGLPSLPDTARLTRHAIGHRVAGVMVLPPFYYKNVSQEGLYTHYAKLIDMVGSDGLRIYLYHIPQVSGVDLSVRLVERLRREFPGIVVGIKDSSGDWENTRALLGIEGLIVYPGSELPLLDALALGAPGCISATANLNAAAIAEVIRMFDEGKLDEAQTAMEKVRAFRLKIQEHPAIAAQKQLLALATAKRDWAVVRPPLDPFGEDAGRQLAGELEAKFGFRAQKTQA